jgi:hypothetical protein
LGSELFVVGVGIGCGEVVGIGLGVGIGIGFELSFAELTLILTQISFLLIRSHLYSNFL